MFPKNKIILSERLFVTEVMSDHNRAIYTRKNKTRLTYDANCTIYTSIFYLRREQLV